jgi:hypothetical protein
MVRRLGAIAGLLLLVASVATGDAKRSWNFDGDKTGEIAPGFVSEEGEWRVVADPSAPSGPNVLAQLARSPGPVFNVVLAGDGIYKDVDMSVAMKAVAGREDQGGGLLWRATGAKSYYVARYNPLEDNYRLYKVENGKRTTLKSADIKHTDGWHTLRVTMQGGYIECYYDGKKYLDAVDTALPEAGKLGLWTKADAQTCFDDLAVSGP